MGMELTATRGAGKLALQRKGLGSVLRRNSRSMKKFADLSRSEARCDVSTTA